MHIRKDDMVVVIAGDDKGPEPRRVLKVMPKLDKAVVEGVNLVYKHVRPGPKNRQGGRLSKEMPVHLSNLMLYNAAAGRPVRVGFRVNADGQKERYCKSTGQALGTLGPAKPARATAATAKK